MGPTGNEAGGSAVAAYGRRTIRKAAVRAGDRLPAGSAATALRR